MRKTLKILSVMLSIFLVFMLSACGSRENKKEEYTYGVISFQQIAGEECCLVFVPAKYCGYIRIHLEVDYITYPKDMKTGDLVKLTFKEGMIIRLGPNNQFFGVSPNLVEVLGSGLALEESGEDYKLTFPKDQVSGITENSTIIDIYADETNIFSINNFTISGQNIIATIKADDIFIVLKNYTANFKAN